MKLTEASIGKNVIRYRITRGKDFFGMDRIFKFLGFENEKIRLQELKYGEVILSKEFKDNGWLYENEIFINPSPKFEKAIGKKIKYCGKSYEWKSELELINAGKFHLGVKDPVNIWNSKSIIYIPLGIYPESFWEIR